MAHVIFVNRFYWPDEPATGQLLTDLAEGLAAQGHDVQVITSRAARAPAREARSRVTIHRLASTRWNRLGLPGKAADFFSFLAAATVAVARLARAGSLVVLMTDPPLMGISGAWAARRRGARHLQWIQDIYPEIACELSGQKWLGVLRPWRDRAWRSAAACVTLGEDMASVARGAGVAALSVHQVSNWPPEGLAPPPDAAVAERRRAWGLEGRFVVGYSGNLGRVHDLAAVLALARALPASTGVTFLIVGGGPQRAGLEAEARRLGLDHVQFRPPQPRADLAASLGVADVHLVTLRAGCERLVYPSKLYGIAAVGRPVLFLGPPACEIARTVTAEDLGAACAATDTAAAAAAVRRLQTSAADRARHAAAGLRFARRHSLSAALARWDALLRQLAPAASASRPAASANVA